MTSAQETAKLFEEHRAGRSYRQIERSLWPYLGDRTPAPETIRTYHNGTVKRPDVMILAGLARVYGIDLRDVFDDYDDLVALITGPSDLGTGNSRWICDSLAAA